MSYWYRQRLMKHNPYHDDEGRFASADTSQIKQAEGLSPHHREVESQLTRQLRNFQRAVADYTQLKDSKGGKILNTDVARELSRHYLGGSHAVSSGTRTRQLVHQKALYRRIGSSPA